jgi:hypothetical protein
VLLSDGTPLPLRLESRPAGGNVRSRTTDSRALQPNPSPRRQRACRRIRAATQIRPAV